MPDERGTSSSREEILKLWYEEYYSSTSATANGSLFERYMHRSMEAPFGPGDSFPRVLEVGGNRGEHVPYIKHQFESYVLSDLFMPDVTSVVDLDPRIRADAADVQDLPYDEAEFDRLIATCLLHHVPDPFLALQEMRRVVRPGGQITVLIPTDQDSPTAPHSASRLAAQLARRASGSSSSSCTRSITSTTSPRSSTRSITSSTRTGSRQTGGRCESRPGTPAFSRLNRSGESESALRPRSRSQSGPCPDMMSPV